MLRSSGWARQMRGTKNIDLFPMHSFPSNQRSRCSALLYFPLSSKIIFLSQTSHEPFSVWFVPSGVLTLFLLGKYRVNKRKAANPPTNVHLLNYSCSWFGGIKFVSICGIEDPDRGRNSLLQLIKSSLGRASCAKHNDFWPLLKALVLSLSWSKWSSLHVTDTFCLASSSRKLFPSSQLHAFSLFEVWVVLHLLAFTHSYRRERKYMEGTQLKGKDKAGGLCCSFPLKFILF